LFLEGVGARVCRLDRLALPCVPGRLTKPDQFRPPGPNTYLGPTVSQRPVRRPDRQDDQYSKQLDDTRKTMAEYWEDGPGTVTPPGHWNQFAQWVARRDANSIDKDARMFFALNNALLDASSSARDGKGAWDSVRPITAVRWLQRGKIIQAWGEPYQVRPTSRVRTGSPIGQPTTRPHRSPSTPLVTPPSVARRPRC
jgi:hypothetical protein